MGLDALGKIQELHHAYLIVGGVDSSRTGVVSLLEKRGVQTIGNPDVQVHAFSELLIDDVRDTLLPFAGLKPLRDRKYLIVSYSRANDASQNALLKAVEESLGNTTFFFCVDSPGHMIQTLRSRCVQVSIGAQDEKDSESEQAETFLKASYQDRLGMVEKMTSYITKTQDRVPVRAFVRTLLTVMHGRNASAGALRDVMDAEKYMRMQGSSPKSVLSHLAVTLPR